MKRSLVDGNASRGLPPVRGQVDVLLEIINALNAVVARAVDGAHLIVDEATVNLLHELVTCQPAKCILRGVAYLVLNRIPLDVTDPEANVQRETSISQAEEEEGPDPRPPPLNSLYGRHHADQK